MPGKTRSGSIENAEEKLDLIVNLLAFLVASNKSITEGARALTPRSVPACS